MKKYEDKYDEHFIRLVRVAAQKFKLRPFLVFDNADQFSESTQDQVFRLAQKFAKELSCSSVISLREESYWKNKDHGTLSAFHAVSYYVQPPRLNQVISRRFKYAQKLLGEIDRDFVDSNGDLVTKQEMGGVLNCISQTILAKDSKYLKLLEHLSPHEIRRPLEFLSRFLVSGHTNMDSLLRSFRRGSQIEIGFHEFLTAIALGDTEIYRENRSDIINIFGVEGRADASNLSRITVIGRLLKARFATTPVGEGFLPVTELVSDCEVMGVFPDTSKSILALLNSKRIAETEAQDKESLSSATFVRATAAAQYYLEELIFEFSYLDIVLTETAIGDKKYYERIKELTEKISNASQGTNVQRLERVKLRIERSKQFLKYVEKEYSNSTLKQNLGMVDESVKKYFETAQGRFLRESHRVQKSAEEVFT